MFPQTSIAELCTDTVYQFAERKPLYLQLLTYLARVFDSNWRTKERATYTPEQISDLFWWVMNEGWEAYGKVNADLPLMWLGTAKRALHWDHMPSNFHPWALAILESFDLPRYQAAYHMEPSEYEAVARDLPLVLQGLRDYPPERFAPPIDEDNWGMSDQ